VSRVTSWAYFWLSASSTRSRGMCTCTLGNATRSPMLMQRYWPYDYTRSISCRQMWTFHAGLVINAADEHECRAVECLVQRVMNTRTEHLSQRLSIVRWRILVLLFRRKEKSDTFSSIQITHRISIICIYVVAVIILKMRHLIWCRLRCSNPN
jgi:hypothetical protein